MMEINDYLFFLKLDENKKAEAMWGLCFFAGRLIK
jgi:hypothetical protein